MQNAKRPAPFAPLPDEAQHWYMKQGLAAFMHFGPNTFHGIEWGEHYGTLTPAQLFPLNVRFDVDRLVRTLKECGFDRLIFTAKHHDGFCLWRTQLTDYSLVTSPYPGDLLEELSDACTRYDLDMGVYLSPWDIHEDKYGCFGNNNPRANSRGFTDYNALYLGWIREICTATRTAPDGSVSYKYGNNNPNRRSDRFVEWWLDGAQGEESNRQTYDWRGIIGEVHAHNPHCILFNTCGAYDGINGEADRVLAGTGGVHWIGNEKGLADDENWAKVKVGSPFVHNHEGNFMQPEPLGDCWSVPECDAKLLDAGWFWSQEKAASLLSIDQLTDIYFSSVGRGGVLLLNVSPNDKGGVDEEQLVRLREFAALRKAMFADDLTRHEGVTACAESVFSEACAAQNLLDNDPDTFWSPEGNTGEAVIRLGQPCRFGLISLEEHIAAGQTIARFAVDWLDGDGSWQPFGEGATVSSLRLLRREPVVSSAVRIRILDALSVPMLERVGVYAAR